jgi:hypothetical protein
MWVQATVLVVLAGLGYLMVALYARAYNPEAGTTDEFGGGNVEQNGPPGAPTRAQLSQLLEALRLQLGVNARGLPRVASVNYDGWPDRLSVVFALDETPAAETAPPPKDLRPLLDVLRAVHDGGLQWRWLMLCGTGRVEVTPGKVAETTVVRATFSRDKLDRTDWSAVTPDSVRDLAEQFNVMLEPTTTQTDPNRAPPSPATSRPATPDDSAPSPAQSSKKST